MTYDALVIDQSALSLLDSAVIDEDWFAEYGIPNNSEGIRRVCLENKIYILSNSADVGSGYLVVNTTEHGVFEGATRKRHRFERILRVALRHFDRNITIPVSWQVYHDNSRLSVYAEPVHRRAGARIYFDQAPGTAGDLYAYATTPKPQSLDEVDPDLAAFRQAIALVEPAVYHDFGQRSPVGNFGILLNERLGASLSGGGTLGEWLERRLNKEQLNFVNKPHEAPVRLRGAAGTGKTQAMVVKLLKDIYDDACGENLKTFLFLTHSSALAHEVIRGMLYALDATERWRTLRTKSDEPKLWVGTLYELAQERLGYTRKGLNPLSLDGREGREFQRMLIGSSIDSALRDPRITLDILAEEVTFLSKLKDKNFREYIVEEIMNEFACVIDAENIIKGTPQAESYLIGTREGWQMDLSSRMQRQAILEIHEEYRKALRNERLLSMDQMIADFGRYLSTHEWDQLRERDGYDVIFVDEYHYFNKIESMTLHSLFKPCAQNAGRWPLFMAYDLKQATNDAGLGGGIERFRNPGVGRSSQIELTENYRSTPQITRFLQDLDAAFPSMDLEGEYNTHITISRQQIGDIPILMEYKRNTDLLDNVFTKANSYARDIGGRKVAVLCLNEGLYDTYKDAGRISGKFISVTSREDFKELQFARTKCVFSMPDYVAGLQFDVVFLIHADESDLSDENLSIGSRRRYVHRFYLGASRAQRKLYIATSLERGGPVGILNDGIVNGSLVRGE